MLSQIAFCQISITNCASLQNISPSGNYYLANSIDCTDVDFKTIAVCPNNFTGSLDGRGFTIYNVSINANSRNEGGIFGSCFGATLKNIVLQNIRVYNRFGSEVGSLIAVCYYSVVENVHLKTSTDFMFNNITGSGLTGGLIGYLANSNVSKCSVINTIVTSHGGVGGGFMGIVHDSNLDQLYNLGVPLHPSYPFISSLCSGGIVSTQAGGTINRVGIESGQVTTSGEGGAISGFLWDVTVLSQAYARQAVRVVCNGGYHCGGLVGWFRYGEGALKASINNVYSKAEIMSSSRVNSGLFGTICFTQVSPPASLNISYAYSSSPLTVANSSTNANVVSEIQFGALSFHQVYFNSQLNSFPGVANGSSTDGSKPQPFTCPLLWSRVNSSFNQVTVWGGDRLRSEYNYTYGPCSCPSGCPN